MSKYPHLRQLGHSTKAPTSPDKALIETVPSPDPRALFLVRFAAPEFTTLCAVTGQPDFAHLVIDYAPRAKLVESKSLKLYLGSFRQMAASYPQVLIAQRTLGQVRADYVRALVEAWQNAVAVQGYLISGGLER